METYINIPEEIHPRDLFGLGEERLHRIKNYFPLLRLNLRGSTLYLTGTARDIKDCEEKFDLVFYHYDRFNRLNDKDIEAIFGDGGMQNGDTVSDISTNGEQTILVGVNGKIIKALTENQTKLVDASKKKDMIFAIGPAGSGKTYTAVALAVRALKEKEVKRIILTRPAVEAGENLGFLPGDMKEKLDPYMQPLYDALKDMLPYQKLIKYLEEGTIEIAPLAFMRGRTLNNAYVILDEAQNATQNQMKMFLTRMGRDAKFIITGDVTQIDLPRNQTSGLLHAAGLLRDIPEIAFVELTAEDVVRHKIVSKIIEAYANKG
ncbi:MAG: PhoH family protein [Bacteroidales bacterium]|jgi:phosphate starvation-inducible PhoH-like protein|nr:PhoH family protein [Bacteroidales bacterium]